MILAAWIFLALGALVVAWFSVKAYVVHLMTESFELGLKMGTLRASMGQDWMDEQLKLAGVDPSKLPNRAEQ